MTSSQWTPNLLLLALFSLVLAACGREGSELSDVSGHAGGEAERHYRHR